MSGFRRYGRKPVKCPVKLSHENIGDFLAETTNISESGLFVASNDSLKEMAVGDMLNGELYCSLVESESTDAAANAELKIVRMTFDGVGLEFA